MALTPPQPDPPRLRQISAICRNGLACSWWVSTLVDTVGPRHAWMFFVQLSKYSIRWKSIHAWRGSTGTNPTVVGNLSKAGRCRIAGCPRHGCRGQAPKDGFTASPKPDTAPPSHGMPAVAFAVAVAVALASAGAGAQPCRYPLHWPPSPASPPDEPSPAFRPARYA